MILPPHFEPGWIRNANGLENDPSPARRLLTLLKPELDSEIELEPLGYRDTYEERERRRRR